MKTKRDDETPAIEMAPMIDCVFLLLIFFLVAATIRKKHNELPIDLPQARNTIVKVPKDETIIISIYSDKEKGAGAVRYRMRSFKDTLTTEGGKNEDFELNDLRMAIAKFNQDQLIRIDADAAVPYGKVTQVIDMLRWNGVFKFGLRTAD